MRRVLPLVVFAACASAGHVAPVKAAAVPCSDDDVDRCLAELHLIHAMAENKAAVHEVLERYCLKGSLESCQELATLRKDRGLDELCKEGIAEACPLPAAPITVHSLLDNCRTAQPGGCRLLAAQGDFPDDLALIRPGCDAGVAGACFLLSQHLIHGDGVPPDRARGVELGWRACLAGFHKACEASEIGARKCQSGNANACEVFLPTNRDSPQALEGKLEVLSGACRHGVDVACGALLRANVAPARVLQLACPDGRTCPTAIAWQPLPDVIALCHASAPELRRWACFHLLSLGHDFSGALDHRTLDELAQPLDVSEAAAWADAACLAGDAEACNRLIRVAWANGKTVKGFELACRVNSTWCSQDSREGLRALADCRDTRAVARCFVAGAWLDGVARSPGFGTNVADELPAVEPYAFACTAGEAAACVLGSHALNHKQVERQLNLLERGCQLKSNEACVERAGLLEKKAACDAGHCSAWANVLASGGEPKRALTLLENACLKGYPPDCAARRAYLNRTTDDYYLRCDQKPALCSSDDLDNLKLWRACTSHQGEQCLRLLEELAPGEPSADAAGWARTACASKQPAGCVWLGLLTKRRDEQLQAYEKGCEYRSAKACRLVASELWSRFPERGGDLSTPVELKRAYKLASQACFDGDGPACELAADFSRSGIGTEKSELDYQRFSQRGRDLRAQ